MLVSEGEELEEVDEPAFGKSMASAMNQSKCVWFLKCLVRVTAAKLTAYRESFGSSTILKY